MEINLKNTVPVQYINKNSYLKCTICMSQYWNYYINVLDCRNTINVTSGKVDYIQGTLFLSNAIISCDPGYSINGTGGNDVTTETIQCLESGFWKQPRSCVRKGKLSFKNNLSTLVSGSMPIEIVIAYFCNIRI